MIDDVANADKPGSFLWGKIERLWRTVKYEDVYLKDYAHFFLARENLADYFEFYNEERKHSSLGKQAPAAVYWAGRVPQQRVG